MTTTAIFLSGMATLGFLVAGLFFFRFWRRTKEQLFLAFGIAFCLVAVNQTAITLLICGRRRLAAFELLGHSTIPARIMPLDKIVRGEYAENVFRKDFTPSEAVEIAETLEPTERVAAKARARSGTGSGGSGGRGKKKNPMGNSQGVSGSASDRVAKAVGMDRKTLQKARAVCDAAKANPEKFGKLKEEMDRTGRVDGPYKRLVPKRRPSGGGPAPMAAPASLAKDHSPGKAGSGPTITPADDQSRQQLADKDPAPGQRLALPSNQYDVVVVDSEYEFVPDIAAPNCVLFLWTRISMLANALSAMAACGFEYRSHLVWAKKIAGHSDGWSLEQHKVLLIATRGDVQTPAPDHPPPSFIVVPPGPNGPRYFLCKIHQWFPTMRKIVLSPNGSSHPAFESHPEEGPKLHEPRAIKRRQHGGAGARPPAIGQ